MIVHKMNLRERYYDFILFGTKRIELRLYDEKRRKIQIGDLIEFSKSEDEKFLVKVVGLLRYESFEDLLRDFSVEMLADGNMAKEGLLAVLDEFYPAKKQAENGVLGIRFELAR